MIGDPYCSEIILPSQTLFRIADTIEARTQKNHPIEGDFLTGQPKWAMLWTAGPSHFVVALIVFAHAKETL